MAGIKIEIDITNLGLEQDEETGELYPGPDLSERIATTIADRIVNSKHRGALERVDERIQSLVEPLVKERVMAVLDGPIEPTDNYGNPKGATTSVNVMVMAAIDKWVRPGDSRRGYDHNNRGTLGELVEALVKQAVTEELKPTIDEAKKGIRSVIVKRAVEAAAESLATTANGGRL